MLRWGKHIFILAVFFAASGLIFVNSAAASGALPPAPTLLGPDETALIGAPKPKISGLTASGTAVYIYIDGVFNGRTDILTHDSGTANFAYSPFLNLSVGAHTVWAVAKDSGGAKSGISNILHFVIEKPYPAPTLIKTTVNKNTVYEKPYISGLAKNNSQIKVYIDKKLFGEFKVKNDDSGTANFAYLPFLPLKEGRHIAYSTAVDERGKESAWSNILYFTVKRPLEPSISLVAASEAEFVEEDKTKADILKTEPEIIKDTTKPTDKEIKKITYKEELNDSEKTPTTTAALGASSTDSIDQLINQIKEDEGDISGSINENNERQGKLKPNLAIFILFLLAVISWIFWVNRELIKEKRANTEKKEADKNN